MENYNRLNIETGLIEFAEGKIVEKKKNSLIPMLFCAAGVALAAVGAHSGLQMVAYLGYGLIGLGIAAFFVLKDKLIYKPTERVINKRTLGFDLNESKKLISILETKDFKKLSELKRNDNNAGLLLVLYSSPMDSICYAQALQYVPYEYVPVTDILKLDGSDADAFIAF